MYPSVSVVSSSQSIVYLTGPVALLVVASKFCICVWPALIVHVPRLLVLHVDDPGNGNGLEHAGSASKHSHKLMLNLLQCIYLKHIRERLNYDMCQHKKLECMGRGMVDSLLPSKKECIWSLFNAEFQEVTTDQSKSSGLRQWDSNTMIKMIKKRTSSSIFFISHSLN